MSAAPRLVSVAPLVGECVTCGRYAEDGVDPCLGVLDGVAHACCGHGSVNKAYVTVGGVRNQDPTTFDGWTYLNGTDALKWFAARGVGPTA